jgi:NTE family protein
VHAKEKSWGPNYLQFGIELAEDVDGDSTYNLGVLYTLTAINALNGEIRFGAQIGQEPALLAEWYQPLDTASRYYINPAIALSSDLYSTRDSNGAVTDYTLARAGVDLAFGRELGTWGDARIGYRFAVGDADVEIGDPALNGYDFRLGQLYLRLAHDVLDNVFFPTSGSKGAVELSTAQHGLGSDTNFSQVQLAYSQAYSWGRHNLVGAFRFDTTIDDDAPLEGLFRTGGFLHLSGFRPNQLSGQHVGQISLAFYRRVSDLRILPAHVGGSIEYGNVWQQASDISLTDGIANGSLFLGADTPIGPLYLGVGFSEAGRTNFFLHLGPVF